MPTVYICACPVCGEVQEVANEKEQLKLYKKWHKAMSEFRPLRRDSLCPSGATLVFTMPAPSGFCEEAGCERV